MNIWIYVANLGGGAIGGIAVSGVALRWLGKAALEKYKAKLKEELEGWKAGYQKALDENRIRFSRLHADRARTIRRLYVRLVAVEAAVNACVPQGGNETARCAATGALGRFKTFLDKNRIFFTESNCKRMDELYDKLLAPYLEVTSFDDVPPHDTRALQDKREAQRRAFDQMRTVVPELRRQLEKDFREVLGMAEGHSAEGSG